MSSTVLRVFGVGRAGDPVDVQVVRHGGLAALVEAVPAEDWSAEALPRRLEDLGWLETQARRHDAVLRAHLPHPVVPFPLTTVFTDEDGVRRALDERVDRLTAALDRVAGRLELGVVVHVDTATVQPAENEPAAAGDRPGAAYIERRLRRQRRAEVARADAAKVADTVHARLAPLAERAVRGNVLNASYLVRTDAVGAFDSEIERLAADIAGARIRRTGPWAPFHFVDQDAAS